MDARREIGERFGLERWVVYDSSELCAGCAFLGGRVWFAFEGPHPPLHPHCRCGRLPVETDGLRAVALMRLVLEARANGRSGRFLEEEARRLRDHEHARRVVNELAARDATFQRLAEAYAREDRVRGGR